MMISHFLRCKLLLNQLVKKTNVTILFCLLIVIPSVSQTLSVTNLIKQNAVLQRNTNVNIWGEGTPGNLVTITLGNENSVTTKISDKGSWSVKIPTGDAGGPYTLNIKDKTKTYNFGGILLGEIWLCSGQSNMGMPMKGWGAGGTIVNASQEISAANFPKIRVFRVAKKASYLQEKEVFGEWVICNPDNVKHFSATAYFFARELYKELNVPIGVIVAARGNSKGEAWTSSNSLTAINGFENVMADLEIAKQTPNTGKYKIDHINNGQQGFNTPGAIYNGMIYPVTPYTIKGVTWYQGENNSGDGIQYRDILRNLITEWRTAFKNVNMPFYIAQITPYEYNVNAKSQEVREAQFLAQNIPDVGTAVLLDTGERKQIHPSKKQEAGMRLAFWALAKQYNQNVAYSGPTYISSEFENGKGILKFSHNKGLKITGDGNFEIAGENGDFKKANAIVKNGTIELTSSTVPNPTQARYAWFNWVEATLFNGDNLPASSFRTTVPGIPKSTIK